MTGMHKWKAFDYSGRTDVAKGVAATSYVKNVYTCSEIQQNGQGRSVESIWVRVWGKAT